MDEISEHITNRVWLIDFEVVAILLQEGVHHSVVRVMSDGLHSHDMWIENDEFIPLFAHKEIEE